MGNTVLESKELCKTYIVDKYSNNVLQNVDFKLEEGTLLDVLVNNNVVSSRREAREFLNAGSITINGDKVTDEAMIINKDLAIEGKMVVIRRGKKKYFVGFFE